MPLSKESQDVRESHITYINTRWKQLHEMTTDASKDAATYLMVTNSGGAVAVMSFMGAMKTISPIPGAIWILAAFLTGIVLLGIARAVNYYRSFWLFNGWRKDVSKYYADGNEWTEVITEDNNRSSYFIWIDMLAWLSFLCFITGLIVGFISILCMKG